MLRSTTPPASLDALFTPKSIALVGVSNKPGSYGQAMDTMCRRGGYAERIMRVNPRLAQPGAGIYAALADLPAGSTLSPAVALPVGTAGDDRRPQQIGRTVGRAATRAADLLANLPKFGRKK